MRKWRLSLRDGTFLEKGDKWSQRDRAVKAAVQEEANWNLLKAEWNKIHDDNPVEAEQVDDNSEEEKSD